MNELISRRWKRGAGLLVLAGLVCAGGCTRHYVMRLSTGAEVDTFSKPKLKGGAYYYRDFYGRDAIMPAARVQSIEPASTAREEKKTVEPYKSPQKRHWYFLWLA